MNVGNTWVEIDLNQIKENFNQIKAQATPANICCVIKANGYGHGSVRLAQELEGAADYFAIANINEGIELRQHGIKTPILCLGYIDSVDYPAVAEHRIEMTVYTEEQAKQLSAVMVEQESVAKIHIKVDTAMSRLGFQPTAENAEAVVRIAQLPGLKITGIFTHFACADTPDMTFTASQYEKYNTFVKQIEAEGVDLGIHHVANSAGIIDGNYKCDMVRAGIILYGSDPNGPEKTTVKAEMAMRFFAKVSSVRTIPAGQGVSYGQTWTAEKDTKIATITCGYADGYFRSLSNKGVMVIHGQPAPIRGRVCMDQIMLDVTGRDDVKMGDTVHIYDPDYPETHIDAVADLAGTISYELFCAVNRRVTRVYKKDGEVIAIDNYLEA